MKRKYIILSILAIWTLPGCKDFLEEPPVLEQSNEITLGSYDGLNLATAGAYSPLASATWYGGNFILINEMKTGNGKKNFGGDYDSGRMNDWYNLNYSENTTSGLYAYGYYVIAAANNIMDNLTPEKGEEQDLNNLRAECLFLRALAHFDLVRTYGQPYTDETRDTDGVPIVLHTESDAKPSRATVAQVYDQVIADLLEAERIIDPDYVRTGSDPKSYASLDAIRALLSRVYLYSRQYQRAADYATLVIESGHYSLWTQDELTYSPDNQNFCYAADVPQGGEVIFEVYGSINNSYSPGLEGLWALTAGSYGDAACADDIVTAYDEGDVRASLFIQDPKNNAGADVFATAKYVGKGAAAQDVTNTIVLRLSEMYLNRAEAILHGAVVENGSGEVNNGGPDLAAIANARGASVEPTSLEGVYEERRKELAWEGHLWFDLGRTERAMTRTDISGTQAPSSVPWPSYLWAMPIPIDEHTANENLTHNPGY